MEGSQRDVLAPETARLPDTAGVVPECLQNRQLRNTASSSFAYLPLRWEVAVSGWNAEQERIVFQQCLWVIESFDVGVLRWSMHRCEDFPREGLGQPDAVSCRAS